jgi:hypothetical protein
MGDADQHREVGVQLFLQRGAWQAWLLATPGFKPLLDGLAHLGDVPVPPIVQGRFSLCAQLLEPPVGSRSTGLHSCNLGSFLPRLACLHEQHHLLFGTLSWFILHNAFPSLHSLLASRVLGSMCGVAFTRCVHLSLFQNRASSRTRGKTLRGGLTHSRQRLRVCAVLRGVACVVAGM